MPVQRNLVHGSAVADFTAGHVFVRDVFNEYLLTSFYALCYMPWAFSECRWQTVDL